MLGWDIDEARRLLFGKRYDPTIDLNTKLNASLLARQCRILAKIISEEMLSYFYMV